MNPTPLSDARSGLQIDAPLRKRGLVVKSLLFLGAIAFALSLAEIGLRVSGFSHFNPYVADPVVGFSLRPNAEGWWRKE